MDNPTTEGLICLTVGLALAWFYAYGIPMALGVAL